MHLIDALIDLFRPKYPIPPVDPGVARAIEGAEDGRREPETFARFSERKASEGYDHDAIFGPRR